MKRLLLLVLVCLPSFLVGQVVYEPVTNNPVYELLDELAALKVININSVVKPYSRVCIANKLKQALEDRKVLNKRQLDEVRFYLKDYSFEGDLNENLVNGMQDLKYWIQDTGYTSNKLRNASVQLNPISFRFNFKTYKLCIIPWLGTRYMLNENGNFFEVLGGGEVYGYLTKHIGYFFNVKCTYQSEPLANPVMLIQEEGKSWNYLWDGSVYNIEWKGGISVGWNWGDFGLYKDRPIWGNANHGTNIMSGHAPSFPYIQLHLKPAKWIEFYSMTGILKSNLIDSSRTKFTAGSEYIKYRKKYFSANFFTITPWKGLDISIGNSIFWSDVIKVDYLGPFSLYKSIDQTLKGSIGYNFGVTNTNDDGHIFIDVCSRNLKFLSLYLGLWIDDWVSSYLFDPALHNALSWKFGCQLFDFPIKNLSIMMETTINRPRVYQQYNPANTYTNDLYSFGNYLRDDSWEFVFQMIFKPIHKLTLRANYNLAQRGDYLFQNNNEYATHPLSKNLTYNSQIYEFQMNFELLNNCNVYLIYKNMKFVGCTQYIPLIFHGNTNSLICGLNIGF